jgi:hypothetical protein
LSIWADPVHIWIAVAVWTAAVVTGCLVLALIVRPVKVGINRLIGNFLKIQEQRDKEAEVAKVVFMERMQVHDESVDGALREMRKRQDVHSEDLKTIHAELRDIRVAQAAHIQNHPR